MKPLRRQPKEPDRPAAARAALALGKLGHLRSALERRDPAPIPTRREPGLPRKTATGRALDYPLGCHLLVFLEKREQVGVDLVRVSCGHPVRKARIHLQGGVLYELRG